VKTLNLTFVVRKSDDGASALLPSWRRHFGEPTCGLSVVNGSGLLLRASDRFSGVNFFFYFFFYFSAVCFLDVLTCFGYFVVAEAECILVSSWY
jgi:hypothetical protein